MDMTVCTHSLIPSAFNYYDWTATGHCAQLHSTAVHDCGHTVGVRGRTGGDEAGMTLDACVSCWGKRRPITQGKY